MTYDDLFALKCTK